MRRKKTQSTWLRTNISCSRCSKTRESSMLQTGSSSETIMPSRLRRRSPTHASTWHIFLITRRLRLIASCNSIRSEPIFECFIIIYNLNRLMEAITSTSKQIVCSTFTFVFTEFGFYIQSFYKGFKFGWLWTPLMDMCTLNWLPAIKRTIWRKK